MSVAPESYRHGYSGIAKSLHWIVAICVLTIVPVGIAMNRVTGDLQNGLFNFHKSLGILILVLMTVRIIYRLAKGAPPHEPGLPAIFVFAGTATHWALYILLLVTPVLGWVGNSAFGASTPFFGLFDLPAIVAKNDALAERVFGIHKLMGYAIGVLFCMHIGAALFHHFIRGDNVLRRMLPGS
jgi:cytochrome b561